MKVVGREHGEARPALHWFTCDDRVGVSFNHEPLHEPERKGEEEEHEERGRREVAEHSRVDTSRNAAALLPRLIEGDESKVLPQRSEPHVRVETACLGAAAAVAVA